MHRAGLALLLVASMLVGMRLFTGIVYRADTPIVALVVKHRPGLAIERTETAAAPLESDIVLDQEEPQLFYGALYLGAMQAAPVAVLVMVAGGVLLMARTRRRA